MMKTTAVRLYGVKDLRLESFELPKIKSTEILAKVISDSICMSTYKAVNQGSSHKRVPSNVDTHPTIIGHEFCLELLEVGEKWQGIYNIGDKYAIQPALNYKGSLDAPGYSYQFIGGNATYVIIPEEVMIQNCLLPFEGEGYFSGSLAEPFSCVAGAFHENFRSNFETHIHDMDIKKDGAMILLAAAGPMGLAAIEYAVNRDITPKLLIVTDIDQNRLDRASKMISPEFAEKKGVKLIYVNTINFSDPVNQIKALNHNQGFDDVFIFAPVKMLAEQGNQLLAQKGCLNFFAGPTDPNFSASFNYYKLHYEGHRITGTSGGNTNDMLEVLDMFSKNILRPEIMISHVGGLDSVIDTTLNLPQVPGAKKLVYTHISMPMTAISDFKELGKNDTIFYELSEICDRHNGLWSVEAENYLLKHGKKIEV
ncbi:zinc-binding dehydrogenase [Mariniplasma sp. M4Ah]|uniref:Zinc-binding dehydrogenase n=2 Tax=Peloplasma aerotolerans TaxID=3044389 RepID=A0AAW6U8K3_9MOLU|nr:zinc-binding dehydrogenase [Mariniplasma sp. M4Ah]MDI6452802.1 zinc-binding dehydrogenase [Mariniplasma sp. M4Ah]